MKNAAKIYPILLGLCFCLSLIFKSSLPSEDYQTRQSNSLQFDHLIRIKKIKPVNRGDFEIQFFLAENCKGGLAVIQLSKNEEGAAILAHYLKSPIEEIKYIFKGRTYNHFPALAYWIGSLNPISTSSTVIAVKEFGSCELISKINWSHI